MARARPGLEKAVGDILTRHGSGGKRISLRQAERLTGLAPATIGELAKGNARTPETIRRFAVGMGEEVGRLLLLAGFVPEELETAVVRTENSPDSSASEGGRPASHSVSASSSLTPAAYNNENRPGNALPFDASQDESEMEPEEREWLGRFGRALAQMPPGRERSLWKDSLRRDTELLESFLERLTEREARLASSSRNGHEEPGNAS